MDLVVHSWSQQSISVVQARRQLHGTTFAGRELVIKYANTTEVCALFAVGVIIMIGDWVVVCLWD